MKIDTRRTGFDAAPLADWFDTIFYALDQLRSDELHLDGSRDPETMQALYQSINDVITRLEPRLNGLKDALIRAHRQAGGSYGELARAMDVPRSTAQTRSIAVQMKQPSTWEQWARHELPNQREQIAAEEAHTGYVLFQSDSDRGEQITDVDHDQDTGLVSIKAGKDKTGAYTYRSDELITIALKLTRDQ